MKKNLLLIFVFLSGITTGFAATFNILISGFSYSPSSVTVNVGDIVNIQASALHPAVQVSQADWSSSPPVANPLPGGWGTNTANFQITIQAADAGQTIFFMCGNHGPSAGMKGQIIVNVATGLEENIKRDFNFTVYPNPVKNNAALNISLKKNDNVIMKIYSLNGKLVSNFLQQKMNAGDYTLPFNGARFETGVYILELRTSQGVLRKQILVSH